MKWNLQRVEVIKEKWPEHGRELLLRRAEWVNDESGFQHSC